MKKATSLIYLIVIFICSRAVNAQKSKFSLIAKTFYSLEEALKRPNKVYRLDLSNQQFETEKITIFKPQKRSS